MEEKKQLKIAKLESYLSALYKAGRNNGRFSVLILGAPGIGKSYSVRSVAQKIAQSLGKTFVDYSDNVADEILADPSKYFAYIDFRLTECEPSDLLGIPINEDGHVRFSPLLWAVVASKTACLICLDELTNLQRPDMVSVSYKVIYDRKAGFTSFHPDSFIVAAGNRPEESSVANLLPTPLINRMIKIEIQPATVDEWFEWMDSKYHDEWDKRTYAFLKRFETENYILMVPKKTETLDQYPTHRTWTTLATYMQKGIQDDETITGLVGEEVGTKFEAFMKVDIDLEQMMANPTSFRTLTVDGKYMLSIMLSTWLTKHIKDPTKSFELIDSMHNDSREFLILTCMGMSKSSLVNLLRILFTARPQYKESLSEIIIKLKEDIQR